VSIKPVIDQKIDAIIPGGVTDAEWDGLAADMGAEGVAANVASPEATEVLNEIWGDPDVTLQGEVESKVEGFLLARGYAVADELERSDAAAKAIADANVSGVDLEFERLSGLTGRTDSKITTAVLDGANSLEHPAVSGKALPGYDAVSDNAEPVFDSHATFIAPIMTQGTNRIEVVPVAVYHEDSDMYFIEGTDTVEGIEKAVEKGARVINMSIILEKYEEDEEEFDNVTPVLEALRKVMKEHPEVLFVKSADNQAKKLGEGEFSPEEWLASNDLPNMIVVGGSDRQGKLWKHTDSYGSNYGRKYVDVAALADGNYSAVTNEREEGSIKLYGYEFWTGEHAGTSYSTPLVANIAAKCMALAPGIEAEQVKWILNKTSDKVEGWKELVEAGGIVNADRAMRLAALIGLIQGGEGQPSMRPRAAADKLGLTGSERDRLLDLADELPD
jgi:subtilisin family serine protease